MPEIVEGVVEIKAIAREPGHRTKIAVAANDANVDPVGACVGARGSRVRMVVNELRGEKVDIVPYSPDPAEFVMKALSPAKVKEVRIVQETGTAEVVVPDYQLSVAIGKEGQNARLAARLTGWRVDIKSESQLYEEEQAPRRGGVGRRRVDHRRVGRDGLAAGRRWRGGIGLRRRLRSRRGRKASTRALRGVGEARRCRAPARSRPTQPVAARWTAAAAEAAAEATVGADGEEGNV